MKVLLFGGTFDPPHKGHLNNLAAAIRLVQPDKAVVMPAGTPPHKAASTTPGAIRLEMCRCFEAVSPAVEVSDWEIRQGGRSYTIHTVEMLQKNDPDAQLYLSLGSDMLLTFRQWYRWQDILRLAALVVQSRETDDADALRAAAKALPGTVLFAGAQPLPCASSDIRAGRYTAAQLDTLLPPPVPEVIKKYHLYQSY